MSEPASKLPRYVMKHDRLRDLGAFVLGVMEHAARYDESPEVREFARTQLELWGQHGYVDVAPEPDPAATTNPTRTENPR